MVVAESQLELNNIALHVSRTLGVCVIALHVKDNTTKKRPTFI